MELKSFLFNFLQLNAIGLNEEIKFLVIVVSLIFSNLSIAKTTDLLCETMAASRGQVALGPAGQYTGRDSSYSTYGVSIKSDVNGK